LDSRLAVLTDLQNLLQKGDIPGATVKNNDLIRGLSARTALAIVRKVGYAPFNELIKKGEPFRSTAVNIAALAQEASFTELTDPEAIRTVVRDLLGEDVGKSAAAFRALKESIGEFGVQYLLEAWNTAGGPRTRAQIQIALSEIGARAVPPMIAALDTQDVLLKGMLISVLSGLKDWRAAAKLRELADDTNLSDDMRSAALKGCIAIVAEHAGADAEKLSASQLDTMIAEDYLANRTSAKRNVIPRFYLSEGARFFAWSFQNGALAYAPVPRFAYNHEMAIEAAARALALDAGNQQAANILVCARMAEIPAGQIILDYDAAQNKTVLTDVERQAITDALAKAQAKAPAAVALGLRALCGAVEMAMNYNLDQSAVMCLNAIATLPEAQTAQFLPEKAEGKEGMYGYPIIKAMWAGSRQVKYTAAITLARISGSRPFAQKELVTDLLLKAMEETATLRVLVVHPDNDARNTLSLSLKALGYDVVVAQDSTEGLAKAMDFPAPDVIIAFNELDRTTNAFIVRLRDNLTTAQMPILIVTTPEMLEGDKTRFSFATVKGFIPNITDQAAIGALLATFKNVSGWQARQNEAILQQAAGIIASVEGPNPIIDLAPYADRLIAITQSDRTLVARVSAMEALGNWGIEAAIAPAGVILANTAAPKELRAASALAIGSILAKGKVNAVSEETLTILLAALNSPDVEVANAAAVALASAPLTPEQRARIPLR
jgi:CheY-like chemotaxis protein